MAAIQQKASAKWEQKQTKRALASHAADELTEAPVEEPAEKRRKLLCEITQAGRSHAFDIWKLQVGSQASKAEPFVCCCLGGVVGAIMCSHAVHSTLSLLCCAVYFLAKLGPGLRRLQPPVPSTAACPAKQRNCGRSQGEDRLPGQVWHTSLCAFGRLQWRPARRLLPVSEGCAARVAC